MERCTFALRVGEGKKGQFRSALGRIWSEMTVLFKKGCIQNFSLWNADSFVFAYCERPDVYETDVFADLQKLWEESGADFSWISAPTETMRLMYEDFGIVREDKSLIRHRVFITKLKPGCEEEYKRRHDGLVAQRNGEVTKGPNSNFSIWCADGYIFGYNEIDVTMESDPTEEEQKFTAEWETRQLEIMDWITNDVDWLTGAYHSPILCIASFPG